MLHPSGCMEQRAGSKEGNEKIEIIAKAAVHMYRIFLLIILIPQCNARSLMDNSCQEFKKFNGDKKENHIRI